VSLRFVSDWRPSTRLKNKRLCWLCFFFLLICWPLSGIKTVQAQESTPTFQPLYTQQPTYIPNSICPGYQPSGWGAVTPDPVWYLYCSKCITPEGSYNWPTYEWPELTPQPTLTGTPEPTQTLALPLGLSLQHNYEPGGSGGGFLDAGILYEHCINVDVDPIPQININNLAGDSSIPVTWGIDFEWYGIHNANSYAPYDVSPVMRFYNSWYADCFVEIIDGRHEGESFWLTEYHQYKDLPILHTYRHNEEFSFNEFDRMNVTCDYSDYRGYEMQISLRLSTLNDSWTMNTITTWWPYDIGARPPDILTPTPTIVPTSSGSDYCDIVLPESGGEPALPIPKIGEPACASLGGLTIGMGWFNTLFGTSLADLVIPGIEACFIPIEFGELQILGVTVNLDLIALGMASILLFRIILRS